jgi:chemotaxis signal transduction protein
MSDASTLVMHFVRANRRHAVAAENLRGIEPFPEPTTVPSSPPALRGLIAWRGDVIPMIEPGAACDEPAAAALVIETDGGALALSADEVIGLAPREPKSTLLDPDTVYHRVREAIRRSVHSGERARP